MVYVLNRDGKPLMPTERHGKVRRMLKAGKAVVVKKCPFTIRLMYETTGYTQDITLGVDAGSKHIGIPASSERKEYYSAQVEQRDDIKAKLSDRREFRRARRNRKTRYRKPRFLNRTASKKQGWLAPSVRQKCNVHLTAIKKVTDILPVKKIVIETAAFDMQKLKADLLELKRPEGAEYQQGEQMGFWNARAYVLHRDGHECQCCHGKSGCKILNVHHIRSRKTDGDTPDNLVTLCEYCHQKYHEGKLELPAMIKKGIIFKDAVFMGVMRWAVYGQLKEVYAPKDVEVKMTYGYITNNTRIEHELKKSHRTDALCIAGHPKATPAKEWYFVKKVRCHNRQLHKATISKGGVRKANQMPYIVRGFRLFDKVKYRGRTGFIWGRRKTGYFVIKDLDGKTIRDGARAKDLILLEKRSGYLTERRKQEIA